MKTPIDIAFLNVNRFRCLPAAIALAAMLSSCSTAVYNEKAYENVTSLKAEAVSLIDKGTEDYATHTSDVTSLKLATSKAAEFAKGLPNNKFVIDEYAIIMNPANSGSLYGVIALWSRQGKLDQAYVDQMKTKIGEQFDQIVQTEQGKLKN
jgi:hypothetical protein